VRNNDGRLAVYSSGVPLSEPGCTGQNPCGMTILTEQVTAGGGWGPWIYLDTAGNANRSVITALVNSNGIKEHFSTYVWSNLNHHLRSDYYP
jgi:hypothetical protein